MKLLDSYSEEVPKVSDYPEEIHWDMLSAQAFITSVQTTTGTKIRQLIVNLPAMPALNVPEFSPFVYRLR